MPQTLDGLHVLLVDDDSDSRDVAQVVMQYQGALVIAVAAAKAAVTILASIRPDVLVSDISMPGFDGYWLMEEAGRLGRLDGVPVLALTAHALPEDRARLLKAGFDDVLTKPFDPNALCGTVQALARGRSAPRTTRETVNELRR